MRVLLSTSLAVLGFLAAAAATASADTIHYGSQDVRAWASDGAGNHDYGQSTSLSSAGSVTTTDGAAWSVTDWTLTATTATFGLDGVATGTGSTLSQHLCRVSFSVDVNTTYSIAGSYSFSDRWDYPTLRGEVLLKSYLIDSITQQVLFSNEQRSIGVDNSGTYYLGGVLDSASLYGSLSGSLLAGHQYFWETFAYVAGNPGTVSGSGSVTLTIGTVVPLPPSALMGLTLLSGLGLGMVLRRRKERSLA